METCGRLPFTNQRTAVLDHPPVHGVQTDCANNFTSIDEILAFTGQTFQVDSISLFELTPSCTVAERTYFWTATQKTSQHGKKHLSTGTSRTPDDYVHTEPLFSMPVSTASLSIPATELNPGSRCDARGVHYCPDTTTLPQSEREAFAPAGAFLHCPLIHDGKIAGRVDFNSRNGHVWTTQEVDALILISRTLSECLYKKRIADLLSNAQTEMRVFLNRLPLFAYVISQTGYRILYSNEFLRRRFPALRPGMVCHRTFWGRETPCPFCPLDEEAGAPRQKTLLYNTPFGPAMDLSISRTFWSETEPTCLVLLSEHFATNKEQEQRAKRETIALALSMSYDTVIDIDPATGRYEFLSPEPLGLVPRAGDYETEIPRMYKTLASPKYLDTVIRTFSLANMLEVFDSGVPEVSLDFECSTSKGVIWKHRRAVPCTLADGSRHIIGYSHDITLQKEIEQHRIQTETAYRLALQTSYTEIYEIDPYTDTVTCIQNNTVPPLELPLSGNLRQDVQYLAQNHIHDADKERFLAHYSHGNITEILSSNADESHTDAEEYRSSAGSRNRWLTSRILPLFTDSQNQEKNTKALVLIRDITEQKLQEEQQRIAAQYDRALRGIFDEVILLNVTKDSYRILYHSEDKYVTPPEQGPLAETVYDEAQNSIHSEDSAHFLQFCSPARVRKEFGAGKEFVIGEFRKLCKDGTYRWVSLTMFPFPPSEDKDEVYLLFSLDISTRKQAEEIAQQNVLLERQRVTDERYKIIVEQTNTLVFEWDETTNSRYFCPEIPMRFAGNYRQDRDIRTVWLDDNVIYKDDLPIALEFFQSVDAGNSHAEMRCRLHRLNGQYVWCKVSISVLRDADGEITRVIGTINDVDEAMRSMNSLKFQAKYDMLTSILNAQAFYAAAASLVESTSGKQYRIVRMDIARFKLVNDLYGLKEGDRLLRAIAGIITAKVSNHGVCGRISGDIFCMCVDFTEEQILERIREITTKLSYYPLPYKIAPAFGICAVDNANTPISVLCDWANIALKTIKGNSLKNYAFYNDTLRSKIFQEKRIESDMHHALRDGQFQMYLQPKVSIASSRIIGAEALVRWQHPSEGLITPDSFVPLFERNGFIVHLDTYIWEQACRAIRDWLDKGHNIGAVSVNVSRMHFHEAGFWKKLVALVEKYRIPPRLLELELTETVFLENATQLGESMQALQDYGFPLSMDDFGSGYSSLTMLKNLPINIIKIDRSFLQEGVSTLQGRIIIQHILSLAKQMRLQSIAEGVETVEQAQFLLDSGCTTAQGFYYSRPVPLEEFERLAFESDELMQPPTQKTVL